MFCRSQLIMRWTFKYFFKLKYLFFVMFNLQVNKFNIAIVAVNNLNTNLLNFLALEANHALKAKLGKF